MQVSVALRESTAKSLIILDEFGKGTATVSFNIFMVLYKYFTKCSGLYPGGWSISAGSLTALLAVTRLPMP